MISVILLICVCVFVVAKSTELDLFFKSLS